MSNGRKIGKKNITSYGNCKRCFYSIQEMAKFKGNLKTGYIADDAKRIFEDDAK